MSESAPTTLDLSFLGRDVRNQIAHSREVIDVIKKLRETLKQVNDPAIKSQIESSIMQLLQTAENISANAQITATSTAGTLNFTGSRAK